MCNLYPTATTITAHPYRCMPSCRWCARCFVQTTTVNDNAARRAKDKAQTLERLKLSVPTYTDTEISGFVTPYAEECAHKAFDQHTKYFVWKTKDDEAWVMRKFSKINTEGVIRLCRVRKLRLVMVGETAHVTCSCMTWEMRRHGCRHVTWAMGPKPTPGFFDPLWTVAHMSTYGRKGNGSYTSLYDQLRSEGKLPGPCVPCWGSLPRGDLLGATTPNGKKKARCLMCKVEQSMNPVEVAPSGDLLFIAADSTGKMVTTEDFDNELHWDEFEVAPEDNVDVGGGQGGNTVVYNDFKDVASRLAGIVERHPAMRAEVTADLESIHAKYLGKAADLGRCEPRPGTFQSPGVALNTLKSVPRGGKW